MSDSLDNIQKKQNKNWYIKITSILTILACIAEILGCGISDGIKYCNTQLSFNIQIQVLKSNSGKGIIVQENGLVYLALPGFDKGTPISTSGIAYVQNIPREYLGKSILIIVRFSKPFKLINPDSLYLLKRDGVYNIRVSLSNSHMIYGTVIDSSNRMPLEQVRVSLNKTTYDHTSTYGEFGLEVITSTETKKAYVISSYKDGYSLSVDTLDSGDVSPFFISLVPLSKNNKPFPGNTLPSTKPKVTPPKYIYTINHYGRNNIDSVLIDGNPVDILSSDWQKITIELTLGNHQIQIFDSGVNIADQNIQVTEKCLLLNKGFSKFWNPC